VELDAEIEAMVRGRAVDPAAARLLEVYGAELYGLLLQLVGDVEAGEAFARLHAEVRTRLPSFSFRYSTRTLLYGMVRRVVRERGLRPTDATDRVGALRDALVPDDRILLTLRVDRELPWEDVARVLLDVDEPDAAATEHVRQRFASLKEELRQRAESAALSATMRPGDAVAAPQIVGRVVGNYRIIKLLGGGGMGVVWLADHVKLGRKAVIKFMQDDLVDDHVHAQRFLNEARTTASIRHPGIVEVFDFSTDDRGHPYIAMELLEGESLRSRIDRESALPVSIALAVTGQIASAVGAAHAAGVIHRDLKPENVFLVPDTESPHGVRVKVLDFGLAKITVNNDPGVTRTGIVVGTPRYMSPEQCRSKAPVDGRTDIYSLGCMLFEMVCGRPPFLGKAPGELMLAHSTLSPPAPNELVPSITPALERTMLRMIEKDPEKRFASMSELVSVIAQLAAAAPPDALVATPVGRPTTPSSPVETPLVRPAKGVAETPLARPAKSSVPPPAVEVPARGSGRLLPVAIAVTVAIAIALAVALR
jgi:serine/threonine protein kinase